MKKKMTKAAAKDLATTLFNNMSDNTILPQTWDSMIDRRKAQQINVATQQIVDFFAERDTE